MVQFDTANRIPTYALYLNLREIMRKLSFVNESPEKFKNFPLIQTDPRSDWLDDQLSVEFGHSKLGTNIRIQNLKKQTEME